MYFDEYLEEKGSATVYSCRGVAVQAYDAGENVSITVTFPKGKLFKGGRLMRHPAHTIIEEVMDTIGRELRFCDECGSPMQEGYCGDDGCFHVCEDCFPKAMDDEFGKGMWRATDKPGCYDGFYEYYDESDDIWEDTGYYYTEWR